MQKVFGVTSGKVAIRESYIDYCSFGKGTENLVILPGLSTRGIKGSELMLAYMYRMFGREFRVFFLDRIKDVPGEYTIEDMAEDAVTFICMRSWVMQLMMKQRILIAEYMHFYWGKTNKMSSFKLVAGGDEGVAWVR